MIFSNETDVFLDAMENVMAWFHVLVLFLCFFSRHKNDVKNG